jgi:hypothetical protein
MNQKVHGNILSVLAEQASFGISFTPAWKVYETRSNDAKYRSKGYKFY